MRWFDMMMAEAASDQLKYVTSFQRIERSDINVAFLVLIA